MRIAVPLLVALLAVPTAATAQWSPGASVDLGVGFGQMALSRAAMNNARKLGSNGEKAFNKGGKAAEPQAVVFDPAFKRSDDVRRLVNHRFIEFYADGDPTSREVMAKKVDSGDYQREFATLLREHGLSDGDLVDVATARYVALWEIVHGSDITRDQAAAIRGQLEAQVSGDRTLARMDDAGKQEIADTYILHVAAARMAYRELVSRKDPATLARWRAGVQKNLLPDGPDLGRLAVTADGFARH